MRLAIKLVDANVLLFASDVEAIEHRTSTEWLDEALAGSETVAFPWASLIAYMRISTHPAVFASPNSISQARTMVSGWLDSPPSTVLDPGPRHLDFLTRCIEDAGRAGALVSDAHIAALALEHGADIVSFDHDFARFDGVRWIRPGR